MKRKHTATFKLKVVLAALRGDKTMAQLCQEFSLAASQIYAWKKELEERGEEIFTGQSPEKVAEKERDGLHAAIGKLKVENDFLSRALDKSR